MKSAFRAMCLILCLFACLPALPRDRINGWIHRGNGDVFPGELAYSGNRIISVRRIQVDHIDTTLHITPVMIDLNFFSFNDSNYVDSIMIQRGVGLYLSKASPYILLKTVRNLQKPDTLGMLVSVPETEGSIHALYQRIYDYLSAAPEDSCRLPLLFQTRNGRKIWWHEIPGMWIPEFQTLVRNSDWEGVWVVRENSLQSDMIFENTRMILGYEDLKTYEKGKSAESDWFETLGNTGIRFPACWFYGMSDSLLKANRLSREVFLQLASVLPAEFLGIDKRFGLLVPGYSASFAVFKEAKGLCEHLVIEGVYVR
ncbi:MAG: hypothetical protein J7K63_07200 [Candidatus Marinimicrobia bacterium]|nr:hypothetical protein [Candidatus Neomarinimicrobiota bacterium]